MTNTLRIGFLFAIALTLAACTKEKAIAIQKTADLLTESVEITQSKLETLILGALPSIGGIGSSLEQRYKDGADTLLSSSVSDQTIKRVLNAQIHPTSASPAAGAQIMGLLVGAREIKESVESLDKGYFFASDGVAGLKKPTQMLALDLSTLAENIKSLPLDNLYALDASAQKMKLIKKSNLTDDEKKLALASLMSEADKVRAKALSDRKEAFGAAITGAEIAIELTKKIDSWDTVTVQDAIHLLSKYSGSLVKISKGEITKEELEEKLASIQSEVSKYNLEERVIFK